LGGADFALRPSIKNEDGKEKENIVIKDLPHLTTCYLFDILYVAILAVSAGKIPCNTRRIYNFRCRNS